MVVFFYMNNKLVLAGVGIVALILVAGAGFFFLSGRQNSSQTSSTKQTENLTPNEPSATQEPTQETSASAKTEDIELTSSGFSPQKITIDKGTKVVWTNKSGKASTVDSSPHPVHTDYPKLNLGSFNDGQTLELIFNEIGTFKYHNHFNPAQNGSVTVK